MPQYVESLEFPPPDIQAPTVDTPKVDTPPVEPLENSWVDAEVEVSVATYQAYQILYYAFIVVMGFAGLDKFLHVLTNWDLYVSSGVASTLHMSPLAVTYLAGIIELMVAAAVALKPRYGSWAATVWLWLVVINLLMIPGHYDIVLRDLALSVAGVAFTRLSAECN